MGGLGVEVKELGSGSGGGEGVGHLILGEKGGRFTGPKKGW